jgi:hypothetical protein
LYNSNGIDYKLISHNPENIDYVIKNYPELLDPSRSSWAFGIWTENAAKW